MKPNPPCEVVRIPSATGGLQHISVFLARAFAEQPVSTPTAPVAAPPAPAGSSGHDPDTTAS